MIKTLLTESDLKALFGSIQIHINIFLHAYSGEKSFATEHFLVMAYKCNKEHG